MLLRWISGRCPCADTEARPCVLSESHHLAWDSRLNARSRRGFWAHLEASRRRREEGRSAPHICEVSAAVSRKVEPCGQWLQVDRHQRGPSADEIQLACFRLAKVRWRLGNLGSVMFLCCAVGGWYLGPTPLGLTLVRRLTVDGGATDLISLLAESCWAWDPAFH